MCSRSDLVLSSPAAALSRFNREDDKLGEGCYGSVFRAVDTSTGIVRAMKTVSKAKDGGELAKREARVMSQTDHPGLIRLYEIIEDSSNFYLITELCNGGDLQDRLERSGKKIKGPVAAPLLRDILRAVHYLQGRYIAHSDIACRNVLLVRPGSLEGNEAKLADFGSAYSFDPSVEGPQKGDLWSCGLILRELVCGPQTARLARKSSVTKIPDQNTAPEKNVASDPFDPVVWAGIPSTALCLCRRLLRKDPLKRWTAEEALHHPWIVDSCQDSPKVPIPDQLVQRIRAYSMCSRLQQIALKALAEHVGGDAEKDAVWSALDLNGDGLLTAKEIVTVVKAAGQACPAAGEVHVALARIDPHETGVIERAFFFGALICPLPTQAATFEDSAVKAALRVLDNDLDGVLGAGDVKRLLPMASNEDVSKLIALADADRDGVLSFTEFKAMLSRSPATRAASISTTIDKSSAMRQLKLQTLAGQSFRTVATDLEQPSATLDDLNDQLKSAASSIMKDLSASRSRKPDKDRKTEPRSKPSTRETAKSTPTDAEVSDVVCVDNEEETSDAYEEMESDEFPQPEAPSWFGADGYMGQTISGLRFGRHIQEGQSQIISL